MRSSIRTVLLAAGAAALSAARPAAAPSPSWMIVVSNGPYAGTYSAKPADVICLRAKKQDFVGASFRDFKANTPRALAEGGIKVDHPDKPGAKTGDLEVAFGTDDKRSIEYDAYNVPITLTPKGKGFDFAGTGKTKEGVVLHITASCIDIDTM